jgi:hypothetical protein
VAGDDAVDGSADDVGSTGAGLSTAAGRGRIATHRGRKPNTTTAAVASTPMSVTTEGETLRAGRARLGKPGESFGNGTGRMTDSARGGG